MTEFKSYKLFKNFFNPYDGEGTPIPGFFENLDYTGITGLDMLSDLITNSMNAYLYNNYGRRYVNSLWSSYLTYDESTHHWVIDTDFYDDFAAALYPALLSAENFYDLTQLEWDEIEEVIKKVKEYDQQHTKTEHGDDVATSDQYADKTEYDNKAYNDTLTDNFAAYTDTVTDNYAQQTDTTTDTRAGYNSSNFENADKSETVSAQHQDTHGTAHGTHQDTHTTAHGAHKDVTDFTGGQRKTTNDYGDIDVTADSYTDEETINTTKPYDRTKLLEIKARLAELNVYKLIGDAVAATMLRSDFDECLSHAGHFFPVD